MEKQAVLDELQETYSGDNWLDVTFAPLTAGITAAQAFKQPAGGVHSIAGIIQHMYYWKLFATKRLEGDGIYDVDQESSFDAHAYSDRGDAGWKALLKDYGELHKRFLAAVAASQENGWQQPVQGRSYTMAYLINGILQHDIYHMGQLALLKRQTAVSDDHLR